MNIPIKYFSLGYNFDPILIEKVSELNEKYKRFGKVNEFFAALSDSPFQSTRPNHRIPSLSWKEFTFHVEKMAERNINFNYLLNSKIEVKEIDKFKITDFLKKLYDIGISQLIVYSPEFCNLIKSINNNFSITISSVYNTRSIEQIDEAIKSGADFIYLDSIFINRNFKLLRKLINHSKIPLKLYANVSCLSQCVNKDLHYAILSNSDNDLQIKMNDQLFHFCSLEKLNNPVKWLQMQWIRPEDINVYSQEGFNFFKLTDRLAPTKNLITIAEYYLKGSSPQNLFPLIERDGTKYRSINSSKNNINPVFYINNEKIPNDFIEHFKSGDCNSTNIYCPYCNNIANKSIELAFNYQKEIIELN